MPPPSGEPARPGHARSRTAVAKALPSYFERAGKEPELLVSELKNEGTHPSVKTTILESLTERIFKTPKGLFQKLYAPPIRRRVFVEIIKLLHVLAIKQRERREMDAEGDQAPPADDEDAQVTSAARRPEFTSQYFATRAPEKEVENQLNWMASALARLMALGPDEGREDSEGAEEPLPLGTCHHKPSVQLALWMMGASDVDVDTAAVCAYVEEGNYELPADLERPVSPWIRHYTLEQLSIDTTWRSRNLCSTSFEADQVWKQTARIAKRALDAAWLEERREQEMRASVAAAAGGRDDAMEDRFGAVIGVQMDALCMIARSKETRISLSDVHFNINVLQHLSASLTDSGRKPHVYRALRSCAVPELVRDIVADVEASRERKRFDYNATMALAEVSMLPNDDVHNPHKQAACVALQSLVMDVRNFPSWDELRSTAIWGLGRLHIEMPTIVILEEITDTNPQIQKSAARALERIWGVKRAITRVLEDALKSGRDSWSTYGRALQWMHDRGKLIETLNDEVVKQSDHDTAECAKTLLAEIGGFSAISKLQYANQAAEEFRKHIREEEQSMREIFFKAIEDAKTGFVVARNMDIAVFAVGVCLLLVSAALALLSDGSLSSWASSGASGGLGVLGILYSTIVAKPRRQVEISIDHLMHLQATFLGFLRQLHHVEQVYSRRMLDEDNIPIADVREYGRMLERAIDRAVASVRRASSYVPATSSSPFAAGGPGAADADMEAAMDLLERGQPTGLPAVRMGRRLVKAGGALLSREGVKLEATPLVKHGSSMDEVIKAISRAAKARLAKPAAAGRLRGLANRVLAETNEPAGDGALVVTSV